MVRLIFLWVLLFLAPALASEARTTVQLMKRVGLKKHTYPALAVFAPDGTMIASGGYGNEIVLWNRARANIVASMVDHEHDIMSLEFSPDGKKLVSGSKDGTARIWDVNHGKAIRVVRARPNWWVTGSDFSRDGKQVIVAAWDRDHRMGELIAFDLESGRESGRISFPSEYLVRFAVSPDGKEVAAGVTDKEAGISWWDMKSKTFSSTRRIEDRLVNLVKYHPNGDVLATDSNDRTWIVNRRKGATRSVAHYFLATTNQGKTLLTANHEEGVVHVWEYETLRSQRLLRLEKGEAAMAVSPDSSELISSKRTGLLTIWCLPAR